MQNVKLFFALLGLMMTQKSNAQYKIEVLDSNTFLLGEGVVLSKTSFRGLSVVDDKTIWVSGSNGTFARSIDGGKTFNYTQIKGYEKSDFRDIEAFDEHNAVMMSSGTPAYILKTTDGGLTWKEVYKNTDSAYFLDAMDFWDIKRGVIVGDPIHDHFVILQTTDGGETWQELDTTRTPRAIEGEAVFAASGTSLRCWGKNEFGFVTGGIASRFISCKLNSKRIRYINTGIVSGKSSQGAFSFATLTERMEIFFVGGDYLSDTQSTSIDFTKGYFKYKTGEVLANSNALYDKELFGYKSAIEILDNSKLASRIRVITTGTSGTCISVLSSSFIGTFFTKIGKYKEPFHVVRKAKKGNAVFLAGPKGKIGKLVY